MFHDIPANLAKSYYVTSDELDGVYLTGNDVTSRVGNYGNEYYIVKDSETSEQVSADPTMSNVSDFFSYKSEAGIPVLRYGDSAAINRHSRIWLNNATAFADFLQDLVKEDDVIEGIYAHIRNKATKEFVITKIRNISYQMEGFINVTDLPDESCYAHSVILSDVISTSYPSVDYIIDPSATWLTIDSRKEQLQFAQNNSTAPRSATITVKGANEEVAWNITQKEMYTLKLTSYGNGTGSFFTDYMKHYWDVEGFTDVSGKKYFKLSAGTVKSWFTLDAPIVSDKFDSRYIFTDEVNGKTLKMTINPADDSTYVFVSYANGNYQQTYLHGGKLKHATTLGETLQDVSLSGNAENGYTLSWSGDYLSAETIPGSIQMNFLYSPDGSRKSHTIGTTNGNAISSSSILGVSTTQLTPKGIRASWDYSQPIGIDNNVNIYVSESVGHERVEKKLNVNFDTDEGIITYSDGTPLARNMEVHYLANLGKMNVDYVADPYCAQIGDYKIKITDPEGTVIFYWNKDMRSPAVSAFYVEHLITNADCIRGKYTIEVFNKSGVFAGGDSIEVYIGDKNYTYAPIAGESTMRVEAEYSNDVPALDMRVPYITSTSITTDISERLYDENYDFESEPFATEHAYRLILKNNIRGEQLPQSIVMYSRGQQVNMLFSFSGDDYAMVWR